MLEPGLGGMVFEDLSGTLIQLKLLWSQGSP